MTTASISIEDYIGAIYRLQTPSENLLPLTALQDFFGFSPISIHEMVQKLVQRGLAEYQPYRGVKLTTSGMATAEALVRRHRIWECFLANELKVPLDEAHILAGDLEHAAPDWVTERLFTYLDEPGFCPHGSKIGKANANLAEVRLDDVKIGQLFRVARIFPEKETVLILASKVGLHPGQTVKVLHTNVREITIKLDDREVQLSKEALSCIWGVETIDGS